MVQINSIFLKLPTCISAFYQTLLIATSIAIQSINRFHSDVLFPVITGKNIQNIGYMAINNKDAVVFWSDISRKTISKAFLKRTGEEKVVQRGMFLI